MNKESIPTWRLLPQYICLDKVPSTYKFPRQTIRSVSTSSDLCVFSYLNFQGTYPAWTPRGRLASQSHVKIGRNPECPHNFLKSQWRGSIPGQQGKATCQQTISREAEYERTNGRNPVEKPKGRHIEHDQEKQICKTELGRKRGCAAFASPKHQGLDGGDEDSEKEVNRVNQQACQQAAGEAQPDPPGVIGEANESHHGS